MRLSKILEGIKIISIKGNTDIDISNIYYDSRRIEESGLFICIEGFNVDGHDFIDKAQKNGALAVVVEKDIENQNIKDLTIIKVDNSREAMSFIACNFYKHPLNKLSLIGVTGTNGKTTTTYLIKSILDEAGFKTGLIGTIKNIIGSKTTPATRTTPESLDLFRLFSRMVKNEITHVVMEVSSHALDLKRVYAIPFDVAVFTNITQDHLDYHKSFEEYLSSKVKLFKQLKKNGAAVINLDDKNSEEIIKANCGRLITYSINQDAKFKAEKVKLSLGGVSYQIKNYLNLEINMNLTGQFNVYNSLAAAAAAFELGIDTNIIKKGLEKIKGVAGRFEQVTEGQKFAVVVDYAHTPDGMENVLLTALEFVKGRILVLFGCGGDRDKKKRPIMGKIAVKYGDYSVVTSDNPRTEDVEDIISDIKEGIVKYSEKNNIQEYEIIPDRREAIFHIINRARKNDMVIIFGKGHETYQIFKDKTISFDDREVAREALKNLYGEKSRDDFND